MSTKQSYDALRHTKLVQFFSNLRARLTCLCCGLQPIQFDHITALEGARMHQHALEIKIVQLRLGLLQPLCITCNKSKGNSPICRVHNRYLGVWNYLPTLANMENV